ncbi:MAG: Panacea domain-containing protein [Corynebacterium sp.]|uniref:Panacea domain-containing protein n=1 Tax=unclassified Corynebacterium TaxID=2624378 RepID=UPI003F93B5B3
MGKLRANRQAIKTAQALNFLIQTSQGDSQSVDGTNILKLVKLLWAADRYSLRSVGSTVTGDRYSAMTYGPVASGTYSLLASTRPKAEISSFVHPVDAEAWREMFQTVDHSVKVIGGLSDDELSAADIMMLEKAYAAFRGSAKFTMAEDISHRYPEWARHSRVLANHKTSKPITMTDFFEDPENDPYFKQDEEVLEAARFFYNERQIISSDLGIAL